MLPFLTNDVRRWMDNVSITLHKFDTYMSNAHSVSLFLPFAACLYWWWALSFLPWRPRWWTGRVPSLCSRTQFELGHNIERERELEGVKSKLLDQDLLRPQFDLSLITWCSVLGPWQFWQFRWQSGQERASWCVTAWQALVMRLGPASFEMVHCECW